MKLSELIARRLAQIERLEHRDDVRGGRGNAAAEDLLQDELPAPHGIGATGVANFNWLWTLMGTPCVNVPGLSDPTGLPLGVQIVGRFGRDRAALEAALFTEQALARRT